MFEHAFDKLIAHLYSPFDPHDPFFVGYLAFSIFLAALAVVTARRSAGLSDLIKLIFRPGIFLHASALLDYRFIVLNYLLFALVFGGMLLGTAAVTDAVLAGYQWVLGPNPHAATQGLWVAAALTLSLYVAIDFANFAGHWLQHRVPFLWEFHKVHHSAEVLTPLTALRVHPVSELLGTQIIACCVGFVNGSFLYFCKGPLVEVTLYGVNAMTFLYYTIGAHHLAHSHVWIMFPCGVREIFYSPALHMIHHSNDPRHYNKNFAFSLTIWDRLAGTLYVPEDREQHDIVLGLGAEQPDFKSVWQLYATPLRNAGGRLLSWKAD